jgi:type II secretory pathway component PulK
VNRAGADLRAGSRRGVALLLVLWLSVLLTFGLYAVMLSATIQGSLSVSHASELAARQAALSGIDQATQVLDEDTTGPETLKESWAGAGAENFEEVALGDPAAPSAFYSLIRSSAGAQELSSPEFGIADEASRININVATEEMLMKLPDMTPEIARAIMDWRDADDFPLENGAESDTYATLTPPYQARNGPFETLHELLYVRGVTESIFYGEDGNLNGVLDAGEDDGDANPPVDNGDGKLQKGLFHFCTVWSYDKNVQNDGRKRVDLNADSDVTLRTELGEVLSSWEISRILQRRAQQRFFSIGELLTIRDPSQPSPERWITREDLMKIGDKVSVTGEERIPGLVNILTAPKEVLLALPGFNEQAADAVLNLRGGDAEFRSIAEILRSEQISDETFIAVAPWITLRSYQFRIDAVGRAADRPIFRRTWAVYDKGGERGRLVYLRETSLHGFPYALAEAQP